MGDFNNNYGEFKVDSKTKRYVVDISSLRCEQLIATRVSSSKESILDHVYVDNCTLNNANTTAVIENDISDHSPTVIAFQLVTDRKKNARPLVRKFLNQNQEKILTDLSEQLRCSAAVLQNDISELIKIMSNFTDKHFPKIQVSRRQYRITKKPWLTKGILKSITTQNKWYAKYKQSNNTSDHNINKEYRNKLTHIKEKAKAMYY